MLKHNPRLRRLVKILGAGRESQAGWVITGHQQSATSEQLELALMSPGLGVEHSNEVWNNQFDQTLNFQVYEGVGMAIGNLAGLARVDFS